ncbi:hypothetical protein ALC57_10035, partial [Trachymyrmex cornetzi]
LRHARRCGRARETTPSRDRAMSRGRRVARREYEHFDWLETAVKSNYVKPPIFQINQFDP